VILPLAVTAVAALAPVQVAHRQVEVPGGTLALTRYAPPARGAGRSPVVLVPDLGFSRALFDLYGEGLARWLAQRGFLVYVAELRGQGPSSPSHELGDVVAEELPAVLRAVADDAPGPVDLVVHGWTGTLALAATVKELDGRVRRVVALDTPVLPEVPSALASLVVEEGGLGTLDRWTFDQLFALGSRFPPRTKAALRSTGLRDLPPQIRQQLLGWWRTGDLRLDDGSTVSARLAAYRLPTLLLLGLADGFAPPEQCSPLREVSKAKVEVRLYSRFENGDDYSHASLLLGAGAPDDVFAPLAAFLEAKAVGP